MRKIVLIICVLLSQFITAQITRTINGVTLGTEYITLTQALKQSGIEFIDFTKDGTEINDNFIILNDYQPFAGCKWLWKIVNFSGTRVSKIFFRQDVVTETEADELFESFKALANALRSKYEHYLLKADFHEVDGGADGYVILNDGVTELQLILQHRPKGESLLFLSYEDVTAKAKQQQAYEDL